MTSINCTIMANLSNSNFLRVSLGINLIICILGLPVFLVYTWKIWSAKNSSLFHVNFKIILQLHLFGFILHVTGRTVLHGLDLFNYLTLLDPCQMIPNIYRCFVFRLMYNSGLWITNSTAVSLILERWLATKRSMTYEKDSTIIGLLLAIVHFLIAALPLCFLYSQTRFDGAVMYYCVTATPSAPYSAQVGATVSICFQVVARIAFEFLLRENKKHKEFDVQSPLSNRYQLEQNISSITALKTFANMSVTYIIFQNLCYITLMYYGIQLERAQYLAILELNGSWPLYGVVSIMIFGKTIRKIHGKIKQSLHGHIKLPNHMYLDVFKRQIA
ncbi:Serpentine Receptor, class AB (class A-like) [Caenorhabditis elegans]|uniref:Serpentine Receptor, class AB (Class A-like) n=1 Tax=Caenorhabditis elegans TaxID=6239 RepID=Q22382_CAEEL|nr:Serpentine Receptor, class AB (class A-like) [Caenorhabditis elegans]CAA96682.3 Serpentine Receptor, class AB (class A-like) [Caenorhabditis elegans]|eukprot:NP_505544.2 Serpentine Receptor, class AB (class A-like) [Caenorhabditis elegans]